VQAHISDPTAELFALKQKPGMSAAQLRLAVDNIYQRAKREGTELKENVLVTAYLQALQDGYKVCMNPYPRTLQEAAERASTHELWARKSNTAPAVKATAAAFSVQESEEKLKSITQEFEKHTKTLLKTVNTLTDQNVGKEMVRGGMRN